MRAVSAARAARRAALKPYRKFSQPPVALDTARAPVRLDTRVAKKGLSATGRGTARLCWRRLQTCENVYHGRAEIGVMVHDLPPSRFTAVDIRDALIKRDVVSTKISLPGLGAYLVCQVTYHPDQGVFEADLAVRGHRCDLLPRTSYLLPANLTATDRVHGRDV